MPEVEHKNQPSIPAPAPKQTAEDATKTLAKTLESAGVTTSDLEREITAILAKKKKEQQEAMKPKEPDWATLTEQESYNPSVYIPVVEHELPDYMNIKLKDTEYEPVWASRDQRRLGQLLAEGYELVKPEHVAAGFKLPLAFDSEGNYVYQDVIALRVHKRILFGKRRRALEISQNQLKRRGADARIKAKLAELIEDDPFLESALLSNRFGFYDTDNAA